MSPRSLVRKPSPADVKLPDTGHRAITLQATSALRLEKPHSHITVAHAKSNNPRLARGVPNNRVGKVRASKLAAQAGVLDCGLVRGHVAVAGASAWSGARPRSSSLA